MEELNLVLHDIVNFVVDTVGSLGYIGIFMMMFLESSFFPFPSEVVMVPAGYLAFKGVMNIYVVIFSGVAGSDVEIYPRYCKPLFSACSYPVLRPRFHRPPEILAWQ